MDFSNNSKSCAQVDTDDFSLRLSLGGLPSSPDQLDQDSTGDDNSPIIVYKAISLGDKTSCVTGLSEMNLKHEMNNDYYVNMKRKEPAESPVFSIHYVDIERPVCFSHVNVTLSDSQVLDIVNKFLTTNSISCEKRKSNSNKFHCQTVVDCSIVKFDIRLVPSRKNQGIDIELKRSVGCSEVFAKVFNSFKQFVPSEFSGSCKSARRSVIDFEEPENVDMLEINKALIALVQWVDYDPLEALQSIGQFCIDKNSHVLQSSQILDAICRVIEKYQECSTESMLLLSLAIACLRQFILSSSGLIIKNELSIEHIRRISKAIRRCASSDDLTAQHEALGLLEELNPLYAEEIKIGIIGIEPISLSTKNSFRSIFVI